MSKKSIIWSVILFIVMPLAYIYGISMLQFANEKNDTQFYLFFAICVAIIIIINVYIIKEISKKK